MNAPIEHNGTQAPRELLAPHLPYACILSDAAHVVLRSYNDTSLSHKRPSAHSRPSSPGPSGPPWRDGRRHPGDESDGRW